MDVNSLVEKKTLNHYPLATRKLIKAELKPRVYQLVRAGKHFSEIAVIISNDEEFTINPKTVSAWYSEELSDLQRTGTFDREKIRKDTVLNCNKTISFWKPIADGDEGSYSLTDRAKAAKVVRDFEHLKASVTGILKGDGEGPSKAGKQRDVTIKFENNTQINNVKEA